MRRKILLLVCTVVCAGVVVLSVRLLQGPVFTESISPDGVYNVQIRTRSGWELLNAPEHLTITLKKASSLQRTTIYAQIHNDMSAIDPEHNAHIFWEDSQLTIILLGCEQLPEIITVSLEKGFPCVRHQYDIPQDISDAVLEKYEITQVSKFDDLGVVKTHNINCADGYFAHIREIKRQNQLQEGTITEREIDLTQDRNSLAYRINLRHSDSGTATATICSDGGTYLQTIEEENVHSADAVSFLDINLDGFVDLQFSLGDTLNKDHALYLWDEDNSQFVKVKCETELYSYEVFDGYIMDTLWSYEHGIEIVETRKHVWQDFSTLVLE